MLTENLWICSCLMTSSLESSISIQSTYQYDIQHQLIHTINQQLPLVCLELCWSTDRLNVVSVNALCQFPASKFSWYFLAI